MVQFEIHRPDNILNLAIITSDTLKHGEAIEKIATGPKAKKSLELQPSAARIVKQARETLNKVSLSTGI